MPCFGMQWLSPNMVMGHFAVGVLSQALYGLGVADALLVILFANLAGMIPVCYFACFGPTFGLRQMILSRFWFGWYGVRIVAFVSVFSGLGWSCINIIVGAELVHAVSNDIPGWVAILVIAFCTFAITLFGYKVVHMYEMWAWLPNFIVYLILLGIFIHSGDYEHIPMGTGSSEVTGVLSFFAVVFGTVISPSVMAADYTVYQPVTQSKWKIFVATGMGLALPSMFTESIAVIVMTATKYGSGESNRFLDGYNESGAGGLIGAVLIPSLGGFGRFCMIIMALSTIAINCANIYSVSLNIKVLGRWTEVVPRFIWAGVAAVVYAALAIIAFSNFATVLNNFMNFITCTLLALPMTRGFND
jgi:NCS1 nucleoside transporter family